MKKIFSFLSPKNSYYVYDRRKSYYSKIDYYENKNYLNSIDKLDSITKTNLSNHVKIEANSKEIKPYNIPFGSSKKATKKVLGTPSFELNNSKIIPKHHVLFYKTVINKYKLLIQVHFIEDKSFFICNQIYSNNQLNDQDKQKIVKLLTEKYSNSPLKNETTISIKLSDKKNNIIFTNDDFSFYIFYLTGNTKSLEKLKKVQEKTTKTKDKREALLNKKLMDSL
jgi:hypothetical protein